MCDSAVEADHSSKFSRMTEVEPRTQSAPRGCVLWGTSLELGRPALRRANPNTPTRASPMVSVLVTSLTWAIAWRPAGGER
jgi:hypothetical protein